VSCSFVMLDKFHSSGWRPRGVLMLAFAASLLLHLAITQWEVRVSDASEAVPPLTATLTELPPPPAPAPVPRPTPRPKRHVRVAPAASAPVVTQAEPAVEQAMAAPQDVAPEPPLAAAPLDEPVAAATELQPLPKQLPPRIDLAYRAFLGTRGFFIGDAVYRLEHSANQYKISTVGEARGLAALFFRGQGKATSEGAITASGLQPNTYSIERTHNYRRESATFDWETGMVILNDDKALPLELPTFDPLAVIWQFYFAPPGEDAAEFNIATTRKIYHYIFHRVGNETVALPFGNVDTQIWRRETGDGGLEAQIWLAPSLHYVAVKVRLANDRATVEALLDSIHVDEAIAQQ
jgi:outer membrane biosynthesis protein TonB